MSHRMARSLSVRAPTSSATYRMGAASTSACRPLAASWARSALRAAGTGRLVSLTSEPRTGPALAFHGRQGGVGLATLRRFLDRAVNLSKTPVEVGDGLGRHLDPGGKRRVPRLKPGYGSPALPHMGGDKLGPLRRPSRHSDRHELEEQPP